MRLKTLKKKKTESHQNFIVSYKKGVEALDELQDLYNNNEQKVTSEEIVAENYLMRWWALG